VSIRHTPGVAPRLAHHSKLNLLGSRKGCASKWKSGFSVRRNQGLEATTRGEEPERIYTRAPPKRVRRAFALSTKTYHGSRLIENFRSTWAITAFNGFTGRAQNSSHPSAFQSKRASGKALTFIRHVDFHWKIPSTDVKIIRQPNL